MRKTILSPGVASGLVKVGFLSNKTSPTKMTTFSSALAVNVVVQNIRVTAVLMEY